MREGGQLHAPAALPPGKRPDTHCIGGWVGHQGRSGRVRKISPPPGFDPRTVQLVASRYTDWAIAAFIACSRLNCTFTFILLCILIELELTQYYILFYTLYLIMLQKLVLCQ
jgi:hypothetical protein